MPNNLLEKITWNFIKEGSQPSVHGYILSVMDKLEALKRSSSMSNSNSDRLATAITDLKEIKKHVNRLEEELEQAKQDHKELQEKFNKLKIKLKAPKEE
jgi:chromosome segregation ATPase